MVSNGERTTLERARPAFQDEIFPNRFNVISDNAISHQASLERCFTNREIGVETPLLWQNEGKRACLTW
jgi:hypothetical protein